jgi:predicted Zn finger-like uncharacterized protein
VSCPCGVVKSPYLLGVIDLTESEQRYNFICPNCSGNFSIQIERIPPVQARFRCPHCKEPMDFPSREEARAFIRLQEETGAAGGAAAPKPPTATSRHSEAGQAASARETSPAPTFGDATSPGEGLRFRIEKPGYQSDVFDRRGLRNLIRTGDVLESDRIRVDDAGPVPAGDLPYLKSLFKMAKTQSAQPPAVCRTHTDRVAFFKCHDTNRPLCESCAPEKKFGGQTIRVCQHCGGTAIDLHSA